MSLENELRQNGFRNEYQKATINIIYTHNYLVTALSDILRTYDITRQQYNVLRILRGQCPNHASVHLIRERMLDKMSDASRIVERLRLKDLIYRKECIIDKRTVEITISEKGLELLSKMEDDVNSMDNHMANLSLEDAKKLMLVRICVFTT